MDLASVGIAACKAAIVGSLVTRRVYLLAALATYLAGFATPACAEDNWIATRVTAAIWPGVSWEQVKAEMLTAFYRSNPDERGVSARGIDELRRIAVAQRRSEAIAHILSYDLDGDGKVTKEEIAAVTQPRARQMIHANAEQEKFRITKKVTMPAGVSGSFVLADQVPPPDGDLSNVCVSSERDKRPIAGSRTNCN